MQQNEKYGVLLLGGHRTHQENYALNFAQDERCRLVAFADEPDAPPERIALGRSLAEELNLPFISDLDAALAREDVHIVSLCTEVERRGRVGVKCAEAGKHVYLTSRWHSIPKIQTRLSPLSQRMVCELRCLAIFIVLGRAPSSRHSPVDTSENFKRFIAMSYSPRDIPAPHPSAKNGSKALLWNATVSLKRT